VKRPGRFDKIVNIPLPDRSARLKILKHYIQKIRANRKDISIGTLANKTSGFSGAELKNLVNLSILNAIKEKSTRASQKNFEYALDRILMGIRRKSHIQNDKDKLRTAYRQYGHLLMNLLNDTNISVHKVKILPMGNNVGYMSTMKDTDTFNMTTKNLEGYLDVCMAGRVAEELIFGKSELSTVWSKDVQNATRIAYDMVRKYGIGLSEDGEFMIGPKKDMSEKSNSMVDYIVEKLVRESLGRTKVSLEKNARKLEKLATELFKRETMNLKEIKQVIG
jgi:ATP-dependent metalloprotease